MLVSPCTVIGDRLSSIGGIEFYPFPKWQKSWSEAGCGKTLGEKVLKLLTSAKMQGSKN